MNTSGSFYPDRFGNDDKGFVTIPYEPIKISGDIENNLSVTDANGYQYTFDHLDKIRVTKPYFMMHNSYKEYASMFKATSIVSPKNEKITFNYDDATLPSIGSNTADYNDIYNCFERNILQEEIIVTIDPEDRPFIEGDDAIEMSRYLSNEGREKAKVVWYENFSKGENEATAFGNRLKVITNFAKPGYNGRGFSTQQSIHFVKKEWDLYLIPILIDNNALSPNNSHEAFGLLQTINFGEGSIIFKDKFLPNNKSDYKALDCILIKNKSGEIIKQIKMFTHRLPGSAPRALLDSIHFCNKDGIKESGYAFDYYQNKDEYYPSIDAMTDVWGYSVGDGFGNSMPQNFLPIGLSFPGDKGGYLDSLKFNFLGYNYYEKEIPYTDGDRVNNGPSYVFDEEFDKGDTIRINMSLNLERITFPTGGSCRFTYGRHKFSRKAERYELDQYADEYPKDAIIYCYPKGLRIQKIEYFDKDNKLSQIKSYKYGKKENGVGFPLIELKDEDFVTSEEIKSPVIAGEPNACKYSHLFTEFNVKFSAKPIRQPLFESGVPVMYDQVTEYDENIIQGEISQTGKTIYKYDFSDLKDVTPERIVFKRSGSISLYTSNVINTGNEWKIGKLLSVEKWRSNNGKYVKVYKNEKKYITHDLLDKVSMLQPYSNCAIEYRIGPPCIPWENRLFDSRIFLKAYGKNSINSEDQYYSTEYISDYKYIIYQKAKSISEEIDSIDGVTTIKKYFYSKNKKFMHLNPIEITQQINDIVYKEKNVYSGDSIPEMSQRNILNRLVSKENWVNNKITSKIKQEYAFYENGVPITNQTQLSPSAIATLKNTYVGQNDASLESRIQYHVYDSIGNPLYVSKDNADKVVYIWSYNRQHPIAEIKNATYAQVVAVFDESTLKAIETKTEPSDNDYLRIRQLSDYTELKDIQITTFKYIPLVGVSEITDPRGITTYYEYDTFGNLKEIYIQENETRKIIKKYNYNYESK